MNDSEFHRLSDATLDTLFALFEEADARGQLDADYEGGIMTLELKDGKQLIISKHLPSRQLWLSSPLSGGLHFAYDAATRQWRLPSGQGLRETLSRDIEQLAGVKVAV